MPLTVTMIKLQLLTQWHYQPSIIVGGSVHQWSHWQPPVL